MIIKAVNRQLFR